MRNIQNGKDSKSTTETIVPECTDGSCEVVDNFDPLIYQGLRFCMGENSKKHIHVTTHDDDIKNLLARAENEIIHKFSSKGQ